MSIRNSAASSAAIVGVGSTPYYRRGESWPQTTTELACKAILAALEDAGLTADDLDGFALYSATIDCALVAHPLAERQTCGAFRMPPSPFCWQCCAQSVDWVELSGRGTVFTYNVTRQALIPQLRSAVPYVVAVIELEGAPGTRLISNVVDVEPERVRIGMPVRVAWDDVDEETTIPRFVPADHASA